MDQGELFFEVRDELFGQRFSPGAVVDRVGEFVVARRERTVEIDVDHLGLLALTHLSQNLSPLPPRIRVVSTKTVDVVNARVCFLWDLAITRRQNNTRAHRDISTPEFGEHRTLEFDEPDVFGAGGFEAHGSQASERQFKRLGVGRVQVFDFDNGAGQVAFVLAVISIGMIRVKQSHHPVRSRRGFREGLRISL